MNRKLKNIELNRLALSEFKNQQKFPITIVLDNIRSMHNVGSVFRTADAFNIQEVILCGITAAPPHREITKAAIGSENSVTWRKEKETARVLKELKQNNIEILGIEQMKESINLQDYSMSVNKKIALVFGNEVDGISDDCIDLCDNFIELPQFGTKHSLNISVCAGIVLWTMAKPFFNTLNE